MEVSFPLWRLTFHQLSDIHSSEVNPRGTWVAKSVKRPTPDFGSGHDLTVCEFKPYVGLRAGGACLGFSLSPSLPQNKYNKLKRKKKSEPQTAEGPRSASSVSGRGQGMQTQTCTWQ